MLWRLGRRHNTSCFAATQRGPQRRSAPLPAIVLLLPGTAPDNNQSERELRRVAVGRKAWLFVGSDDHAQAAGHILSLIASARLHDLDPERYLRDISRVLAHWPKDRYLELAPRYWIETRARLDLTQLDAEIGPVTVPPPRAAAPAQESTSG